MPAPGTRSAGGYLLAVVALAAAYYGAAKLGLRLAYLDGAVTALWPPVGVGIAALTLFGPRLWPGIVVGDLLVGDYSTPLGTVLGQTTGNTLEVLIAALLLRRLVGGGVGLTRVVQVLALVGCAAVGTLVSACFGSASLRLGNVITADEFAEVWRTWWLSDFSGALVVTPVILSWANPGPFRLGRRQALEGVALLTVLVLVAELPSQRDVPYIVFPLLIWAALRFGPRGASLSLLVASGLTVLNTAHNAGPFVRESITDSLLSTQLFLATAALSSLVLAAVTAERATAAAALRANEERLRSVVRCMTEGLIVRDVRRRHHRVQRGRGAAHRAEPRSTSRPAPRRGDRARRRRARRAAHGRAAAGGPRAHRRRGGIRDGGPGDPAGRHGGVGVGQLGPGARRGRSTSPGW